MDVQFEPAVPSDGEPGSTFSNARVSERWPGLYTGRCRHCDAYFIADKRAPRCDVCEDRRLTALVRQDPSTEGDRLRAEYDGKKIDRLTRALSALTARYVQVASYAYGAVYSPEREPVVQEARAALRGLKV